MKSKILLLFCALFWLSEINAQNEGSRFSTTWQYGHCLKEVHFGGTPNTNYIPITKDSATGEFLAPQFVKSHPDGCENSTGGTIVEQEPVAYVSGTKARVKACFLTDCTHSYYIRGLGPYIDVNQTSVRIEFPKQMVTPSGGQVLYDWRDASIPFVLHKVKYFEKFTIKWQISEDGNNWLDIDQSENTLYVTHDISIASTNFHTLLDVSCKEANGLSVESEIVNKSYLPFSKPNLEVKRASDDFILTYYGIFPAPLYCFTVEELLATGDGRCGAWADFLDQIIKVQGITGSQVRAILPNGTPSGSVVQLNPQDLSDLSQAINQNFPGNNWTLEFNAVLFLVKEWGTVASGQFIPLSGANYNEAMSDLGLTGVKGQGNVMDPRSIFPNHAVVSYQNNLYDPSYGSFFNGTNLIEFEDTSIDAVKGTIVTIELNNSIKYFFWVSKPNTLNFEDLKLY